MSCNWGQIISFWGDIINLWGHIISFWGHIISFGGQYPYWGPRIYWGQDYHFMGGFRIGGKIINLWGHIINFWGRDYQLHRINRVQYADEYDQGPRITRVQHEFPKIDFCETDYRGQPDQHFD